MQVHRRGVFLPILYRGFQQGTSPLTQTHVVQQLTIADMALAQDVQSVLLRRNL
jgi:hypothetical protein